MLKTIRVSVRRWAYGNDTWIRRGRAARMADMIRLLQLPKGARIIDLGGTPYVWNLVEHDYHVTLVNLPKMMKRTPVDRNRFEAVEGDATNLRDLFADQSFDAVFSNSVIEHVGDQEQQRKFAQEVRRLGRSYWVQTPGDHFILEPHTGYPLYWQTRRVLGLELRRNDIRVLSKEWMQELFPDGEVYLEKMLGMEKSYVLYRPYASQAEPREAVMNRSVEQMVS